MPIDASIAAFILRCGARACLGNSSNGIVPVLWNISRERLLEQLEDGTCYLSSVDELKEQAQILYLKSGDRNKVLNGEVKVCGKDNTGKLVIEDGGKVFRPKDVWMRDSHDATSGSVLLNSIFKAKTFSFPKSLYAVHDALRFFVANKPNALILDFFAGSGTTLHAVNLLNAEDGGRRQCVMVTNNEVSDAEARSLAEQGYKPGDEEWERLGIARYVTWPRTVCSIEGHDVKGAPLKGEYLGSGRKMSDGFKANAAFFKLGFLDKTAISLGRLRDHQAQHMGGRCRRGRGRERRFCLLAAESATRPMGAPDAV